MVCLFIHDSATLGAFETRQTDIQYWDDTLTEDIQAIQTMLDRIPSIINASDKANAIDRCKARLRSAGGTKRSFKMECRLVQDVGLRRKFEARLQALDSQLKTLTADLKAIEQESNRSNLMGDRGGDGNRGSNGLDGVKAGDSMLAEAADMQNKTADSLANTKNMIAESKEVGAATLEELHRQREVISNIEKETDRIDDNLARAEALLKQFGKRMASDSFIQCFALINCILLLAVILYAIIKKGGLAGGNDGQPDAPARRMLRHANFSVFHDGTP